MRIAASPRRRTPFARGTLRLAVPGALLAVVLAAVPLGAQTDRTTVPADAAYPSVARFAFPHSPISLTDDVRPGMFLGVMGPQSAWLGTETGPAELWVHPLKVASAFQLQFKIPEYREPLTSEDVARTIEVGPASATITYSHAAFTVKEHIIAPRGESGLLVLLDVHTFQPLTILVQFKPVLQYMWPAAFGGQYVYWDPDHRAFVLSESLQKHNAVIGTSWPAEGETLPAHKMADAPATMTIPVDTARIRHEFIPIAIAAGTEPRDSVFATYHRLLADAHALVEDKAAWADSVLASTTSIETPDDSLDLALRWAESNMEDQRVCNPDLGCGLVAGWGPSGSSARPGFGWFFGGDAAINSLAMDESGQWGLVADGLRFMAKYQRADGKMPHEISQAAAHVPWFTEYPYPYYHADTTPYWMVALWQYWRATGDDATVRALWPAYQKAWAWCLTTETDGDGIIENSAGGYGAIEVGGLGKGLHEDIYLAGVWITALQGTRELAAHLGDAQLAAHATAIRDTAMTTLNERYWRPKEDQHAFAILEGGGTNDNLTAWPGTALSFGLLEPKRAERTLRKLATDSISSDWGARLLSVGSPLYDPLHYNNGAVWPFMTGFVSWGQYRYRRPWSGYGLLDAIKQLCFDWSRGHWPENLSGAYFEPMDATVPDQFFAASMMITPLMRGVLGWAPDAPRHSAALAPQLPPAWDTVRVHRLRVGATSVEAELVQGAGRAGARLTASGAAVDVDVTLGVPLGARDVRVEGGAMVVSREVAGAGRSDSSGPVTWGPHDGQVTRRLHLEAGRSASVAVTWKGGLSVEPPTVHLVPGQESTGVRVVDFTKEGDGWLLELEGQAGRTYTLDLYGERPSVARASGADARLGADEPSAVGARHPLQVRFPAGEGRVEAQVHLRPEAGR
jgi:glycogen debranching enzyme